MCDLWSEDYWLNNLIYDIAIQAIIAFVFSSHAGFPGVF